jgi:hypothetical protein
MATEKPGFSPERQEQFFNDIPWPWTEEFPTDNQIQRLFQT